jgi:hypothetical protein
VLQGLDVQAPELGVDRFRLVNLAETFVATRGARLAGFGFVAVGLFFLAAVGNVFPRVAILP